MLAKAVHWLLEPSCACTPAKKSVVTPAPSVISPPVAPTADRRVVTPESTVTFVTSAKGVFGVSDAALLSAARGVPALPGPVTATRVVTTTSTVVRAPPPRRRVASAPVAIPTSRRRCVAASDDAATTEGPAAFGAAHLTPRGVERRW